MRQVATTLIRLNLDTRDLHPSIDRFWLALIDKPTTTEAEYREHLERAYGFEAPIEAALAYTHRLQELVGVTHRFRSGLIAQDLLNLGVPAQKLASLPQAAVAPFSSISEALGWLYVHERATLIHGTVCGVVLDRLPHLAHASSYLCAHSGHIGSRWDELGETLDALARTPMIYQRISRAAVDAFETAIAWYGVDVAKRSAS
jgi:heme oxygenase